MFILAGGLPVPAGTPIQQPSVVFRRADREPTLVRVGTGDRPGPPVSPRLFSNFLEHLGGSIYESLWANIVYNPQFEPERHDTPSRWTTHGAVWLEDGVVGRALRLPEAARVEQDVSLPVHRQLRYTGSVWVRSLRSRSPVLSVSLRHATGDEICSAAVRAGGSRWLPRRFVFRLTDGAIAPGERLQLVVEAVSGETDVDMLEIFPADAIGGVDPEVLQIAKGLRIPALRWPGGNFASGYHWRNGVGPRERRPTVPNPAWSGLETHHFGTDEFLTFCRRIGASPHICVNAGDGTPEEAAAWVEYCNGSVSTPMGALRAANGHPEPYGVRIWEIGNELYGSWQIGHTDAAGNARRFVEFRRAMLAVDPTIEIIATGKGDQFVGDGLQFDRQWNEAVLDAARRDGAPPQHLSLHPLVPLPSGLQGHHSYDEIYLSAMAHPHWWAETFVADLRKLLAQHGGQPTPKAAVTEWGIIVGGREWRDYPNHDDHSGAVYAGLFYHALMKAADVVDIANVTALMHGGCIRKSRGRVYVTPMIHVQRMYSNARPDRLVPLEITGPAYDVPRRGLLPEVRDVPWVDVMAGHVKGRYYVYIVNRDAADQRRIEITFPAAVRDAAIDTLAADVRASNDAETPDRVAPRTRQLTADGRKLAMDLPPASVSILTVRLK